MPESEARLAQMRRLRQLALEIRAALNRNDLQVVSRAASLLAPTLESRPTLCKDTEPVEWPPEAAEIVHETQALLAESIERLTQAMNRLSAERRRLQRGKRVVAVVRNRRMPVSGVKLDTGR